MRLHRTCGVWLVMMTLPLATPAKAQIPDELVNLQYFPEDISRDSLITVMREFSFALGVRCQYCHTGGDGISFEGVVFDSDEDPDKRKARFMLRLVETLNRSMLPMMADRDEPAKAVECKTCHRGQPKPTLLRDELRATLDGAGADSMAVRYRRWRERLMTHGYFDFGEWETNTLAERLTAEERYDDAIAVYEMNLEFYPESVSILSALGGLYEEIGDTDGAVGYYERVLEVSPENRRALERLEALRGG
jgi:hypothetical protein